MLEKNTLENSIVRLGNNHRLKAFFARAEAGEKLTVGFIGGSITQGSLASTDKLCYAYRTFEWLCKTFPKAEFTYVNAGVGGTTSQFGASRAEKDLLSKNPDLAFIEFSVNDTNNDFFMETYEGLVRRVYCHKSAPAVVVLHNVQYDDGVSAEEVHATVGEHYALPAASVKRGEYREILDGKIRREDVTPDMLHPNDAGHEMLAEQLTYLLDKIRTSDCEDAEFPFPEKPLTENRFEGAGRIQSEPGCGCGAAGGSLAGSSAAGDSLTGNNPGARDITVSLRGFEPDPEPKVASWDHFKNGWTAVNEGDRICFELEAAVIAVQYRKTPEKPAPRAIAVIDGNEESAVVLDGAFDETWGDCLYCETVLNTGTVAKHTVDIRITETHAEDVKPFYLLSVLYA